MKSTKKGKAKPILIDEGDGFWRIKASEGKALVRYGNEIPLYTKMSSLVICVEDE